MWPGNSIKACSTEREALDGCLIVHPVSRRREREKERGKKSDKEGERKERIGGACVYIYIYMGCKRIALARA